MRKHVKTVHGEAAYRNKKHKGLNCVRHNGCNKVSSSTGGSIITTSAIVHQEPNLSMQSNHTNHYSTGLRDVKSEFETNGHQQLSSTSVQMETASLLGMDRPSILNSMSNNATSANYLQSNGASSTSRQTAQPITGQFESGLINGNYHDQGRSSFSTSNHLNSETSLASHLTTKTEPSQFNDLNNYNYYNSYGARNLLDSNTLPHTQSIISENKVTTTSNLSENSKPQSHHQQHQQSTNWTPRQLTTNNYTNNYHNDPYSSNLQQTIMPPSQSTMINSQQNDLTNIGLQSNYHLNQSNSSLIKSRDMSQCVVGAEVDEGIGSESVTQVTDEEDDEPNQRVMSNMMPHHYHGSSGVAGGDSMMVMTQHQPLTRATIKSNRPSFKNRLRNGFKSWIPNIFHKNSTTTTGGNNTCQKSTDYDQQYDASYNETTAQLDSLNCSNYQPIGSTCSSRQSGLSKKKSKEGNISSLSLKVPFLKSRKNKSYEETVLNGKDCKESQLNQSTTLEDQLDLLPDEVMHFLKENKDDHQDLVSGPLSPGIQSNNNECSVKMNQLSNCVQSSKGNVVKQDSLIGSKTSQLNNASVQQPFSPISINSSPNTPAAIINNPLSPMQTDQNLNSGMNNASTVNKPPPTYAFATQQLNQQQQVDQQCNTNSFGSNAQPAYLNQPYNQNYSTNYNQINNSNNYYSSNYPTNSSTTVNVPNNNVEYNNQIKTETNNDCAGNMSRIQKYVNNQNINIYLNGNSQNNMMQQSSFYNHPMYMSSTPTQNAYNSYYSNNWQHQSFNHYQHSGNQGQSRQPSAMSIDTNNNSSAGNQNNYCKYNNGNNSSYQNNLMPPPITYSQQLSSQLTPPIPSSLLMNQGPVDSMQMNEMCSPRPMSAMNRCESRCDSRSRLMSPMQICNDATGNMVINDMSSGLSSLAEENLILKMRLQ